MDKELIDRVRHAVAGFSDGPKALEALEGLLAKPPAGYAEKETFLQAFHTVSTQVANYINHAGILQLSEDLEKLPKAISLASPGKDISFVVTKSGPRNIVDLRREGRLQEAFSDTTQALEKLAGDFQRAINGVYEGLGLSRPTERGRA